jgi:lipoprotein signal peptidase
MEERRFMNGTGRGGLICVALLLFILAGSGIVCASPAGEGQEIVLGEPADTTRYQGSGSAFSIFYNPMLLGCGFGAVIVLVLGYYLIRRSRGKGKSATER